MSFWLFQVLLEFKIFSTSFFSKYLEAVLTYTIAYLMFLILSYIELKNIIPNL